MPFRLLVTADLHFDVARSRGPAVRLIEQMNQVQADVVLLVGDTATADATDQGALERCLERFRSDRPNLFVPGNHEWWSRRRNVPRETLESEELPARVTAAGWQWLPGKPFAWNGVGIVGSCGWYDYAFAEPRLGIERSFYEAGLSPASARRLGRLDLFDADAEAIESGSNGAFLARWNDGRHIFGRSSDLEFRDLQLERLRADLGGVHGVEQIVAAVHVCPHEGLLPRIPAGTVAPSKLKYAFARAFLGSPRFGELLAADRRVRHVVCGHSHIHRHFAENGCAWTNIGSGYTQKRFAAVNVE